MIITKELKTIEDFEALQEGDNLACEFNKTIHESKKMYRFKIFQVAKVKPDTKEIILQVKNNLYFNYQMFVDGNSTLENATLITCKNE